MLRFVSSTLSWFNRQKRFIGTVAIGHTAKNAEEFLFDWLLYGVVAAWATSIHGAIWGSLVTFAIMAPLSALVCWLYLRFYDWAKIDWFGFEALKEAKNAIEGDRWWMQIVRRILRLGDIPAFIALSIHGDPFMTVVYLRKGSTYEGFTERDWKIFWASVLFSNVYWTLRWVVIVEVVIYLWNLAF